MDKATPIIITKTKFIFLKENLFLCRRCRESINIDENYCYRCGLNIDWGEEEILNNK